MDNLTHESRKAARITRYENLIKKHQHLANERYKRYQSISSCIPLGQPILVGHHSERRHRADLKRIDHSMRKLSEHHDKAEYYKTKLESLLNNNNIYSSDEDAINKLEIRLKLIVDKIEAFKQFNINWKSKGLEEAYKLWPFRRDIVESIVDCHKWTWNDEKGQREPIDRRILPSYVLTNLNAKLKRYEDKLQSLKSIKEMDAAVWFESDAVKAVVEDARINVYFNEKPNEQTRMRLKRSPIALKWSPSRSVWTRLITPSTPVRHIKSALVEVLGALNG